MSEIDQIRSNCTLQKEAKLQKVVRKVVPKIILDQIKYKLQNINDELLNSLMAVLGKKIAQAKTKTYVSTFIKSDKCYSDHSLILLLCFKILLQHF